YGEELAAKTKLGLEICEVLERLLQEKAETAVAMAARRATETRRFLKTRVEVVSGFSILAGLVPVAAGVYGAWKGYSVADMLAIIVGGSPPVAPDSMPNDVDALKKLLIETHAKLSGAEVTRLAMTLLIGALCGAGSALIPFMEKEEALQLE